VHERVQLLPVADSEAPEFLAMAAAYFRELNPNFVASADWQSGFFSGVKNSPGTYARWIHCDGERAGFAIYGIEGHRFLPRKTAWVYEFYVQPRFRRSGVGREAAEQMLDVLRMSGSSKIQLEITSGNAAAAAFWARFGFGKVSERHVLHQRPK